MPVLHMSRCCVLRRLILRLQPGRALNHDVPRAPEQVKQLRGGRRQCLALRYWGCA